VLVQTLLQRRLPIVAPAVILLWCLQLGHANAQDNVKQGDTPKSIGFDFTPPGKLVGTFEPRSKSEKPERVLPAEFKTFFSYDGAGYEATYAFLMRRPKVAAAVRTSPIGPTELKQTNADALVELRETQRLGERIEYEIASKVSVRRDDLTAQARQSALEALSAELQQAREEAKSKDKPALKSYLARRGVDAGEDDVEKLRERYVPERAIEQGAGTMRAKLGEFADRRPGWILDTERVAWRQGTGRQLFDEYRRLVELELGEEYLERLGFTIDAGKRTGMALIDSKLTGVFALLNADKSKTDSQVLGAGRALSQEEIDRLFAAMTVRLSGRLLSLADAADENSQWFNAQRVACQARGAASIRIEGSLDPKNHDAADWWLLEGYDAARVVMSEPQNAKIVVEKFLDEKPARLRVFTTGGEPVAYVIDFKVKSPGPAPRELVIHEYAPAKEIKFPF
jgi:hypothetical protein